ncbi:MAG: M56 family metallopeptidase [Gemmatimonadota bacterium]
MIAAWMLFTVFVTALAALGALGAERILQHRGLPARWSWVWAGVLALLLPLVRLSGVPWTADAATPPPPTEVVVLDGLQLTIPSSTGADRLDRWMVILWGLASALALAWVALAVLRLRRRARSWTPEVAAGEAVWISEQTGPAVVGFWQPRIVLPRWALSAPGLPLMVAHEREHVRAGDGRLLAMATMLVAALPWNAPLWWMLRRLRGAMESDCDQRVLRRAGVRLRDYCELLLQVGSVRPVSGVPLPALSEPPSLLERRIDRMTGGARLRVPVLVALTVSAGIALAVACFAPGPERAGITAPVVEDAADAEAIRSGPTFTPFTVRPDLKNAMRVTEELQAAYPPLLRDAGVGGTTNVWFHIQADGIVDDVRVQNSSGHPALDEAALQVARIMEFTPALNGETPVPVWVAFPITFRRNATAEREGTVAPERADGETRGSPPRARGGPVDVPEGAEFTPFTVPPRLQDAEAAATRLQREYPPLLRDAGIEGEALVWFHIDDEGTVTDVRLGRTSGHQALDEAAMSVARSFRFAPARNGDDPVAVWVAYPMAFELPKAR